MSDDITPDEAARMLAQVSDDKAFIVHAGGMLRSLHDLKTICASMKKEVFDHHVSAKNNDFANWVRDVCTDPELAHVLKSVKTPEELSKIVGTRILELEKISRRDDSVRVVHHQSHDPDVQDAHEASHHEHHHLNAHAHHDDTTLARAAASALASDDTRANTHASYPHHRHASDRLTSDFDVSRFSSLGKQEHRIPAGVLDFLIGLIVGFAIGFFVSSLL